MRSSRGTQIAHNMSRLLRDKKEAKKACQEKEEGEVYDEVDIPVKIDPNGTNDRSNTTKVTFIKLDSFADAGEAVIELRRELNIFLEEIWATTVAVVLNAHHAHHSAHHTACIRKYTTHHIRIRKNQDFLPQDTK